MTFEVVWRVFHFASIYNSNSELNLRLLDFENLTGKAILLCIYHMHKNKYSVKVIQLVMSPKLRRPKKDWNFAPRKVFMEISSYVP